MAVGLFGIWNCGRNSVHKNNSIVLVIVSSTILGKLRMVCARFCSNAFRSNETKGDGQSGTAVVVVADWWGLAGGVEE